MNKPASPGVLLTLNAYWAGLSFMWSALHPLVLPAILIQLVPDYKKNTVLGLLTFAGLIIAMVLQPVSGAVSDRWHSRYGRRRPLMVIGTLIDCVFLLILGWGSGLLWVTVGYIGLQLSSNTAQGPLQGLLRDRVPAAQLGLASSIKIFLDLASLVAASLVAGHLMRDGNIGISATILTILGLLLVSAAITIGFTHEQPTVGPGRDSQTVTEVERPAIPEENHGYRWLIAERGVFLFGVYGLQAFGQYYLQDAFQLSDAAQQAGRLLATIGGGTIALVVLGGALADKYDPRRLLHTANAVAALGMIMMVLTKDLRGLYLSGSLVGAGIGLFLTCNWTLANRLAPAARAGRYLGLTNLATAGAAALARLQGPAVDILNAARPGAWLGYKGIFAAGAICILLSSWFLTKVRRA